MQYKLFTDIAALLYSPAINYDHAGRTPAKESIQHRSIRTYSAFTNKQVYTMSTRVIGGVTVPDTPLITSALQFARENIEESLYNHVVRAWFFGFIIADKVPALQDRDREVHSVAAILHDLGFKPHP